MDREMIELVVSQLLFWAAVVFFLWMMRGGADRMVPQLEALADGKLGNGLIRAESLFYTTPEQVMEVIGNYQNAPIYRYAIIDGKTYLFDHILLSGEMILADRGQRCLAPGLVYLECKDLERNSTSAIMRRSGAD